MGLHDVMEYVRFGFLSMMVRTSNFYPCKLIALKGSCRLLLLLIFVNNTVPYGGGHENLCERVDLFISYNQNASLIH